MTIIGVAGAIGAGKSFTQLKHGLNYCEERQKQLVCNFNLNKKALLEYARSPLILDSLIGKFYFNFRWLVFYFALNLSQIGIGKKPSIPRFKPRLPWIVSLVRSGKGIIEIPNPSNLESLMIPESVILLDEAGILLNSREFATTSKKLLADLAQSRKDGCDLIWCAQFDEQVDRQMRLLTQFWIHCQSLSIYDKKFRRPRLHWKQIFWFRCSDYSLWQKNFRDRGSYFRTKFAYATQTEEGLLSHGDKLIFNIFDSFSRLDIIGNSINTKIATIWACDLTKDYYFSKLNLYSEYIDPLSKNYQILYGYYSKKKIINTDSFVITPSDSFSNRSSLISKALQLSRKKGVKPPYFKNCTDDQIKNFISKYQ